MTILRDLSIFWGMFHVLFLFVMLFRSRFTPRKSILAVVIGMGTLMILNGAGLVIYGIDALSKAFLITCSIPSFIFFYVMSEDKRFRFLFTFCLADTTCLWIMAVTNLLDYYLGGGQYIVMLISRLIAYPLIEYLVWRYLRKPYLELQKAVERGWGIFAGMTMLYYILLVVVVQFPTNIVERPEDMFLCVLVLLLMVFNYATIFLSLYRQLLLYQKQQSEYMLQGEKGKLEAQLDNQQRIRKMKHDMKGHTITLSGLLAAGKMKEMTEYLKGMEKEIDASVGQLCANPYLNAVFSYYYQKFQEIGAGCKLDIQVGEEELPHMELCQILSNSLENAFDAVRELEPKKRKVSVQMKYNRDYLIMRIKNCCKDSLCVEKGTVPATDKEGHDHGFGLLTIQEAAELLKGEMLCYTKDREFVLDVMLSCDSFQKNKRETDLKFMEI
ncbi:MAG: GHKL domain-containing protein [Lachnospiraceae bacterium]|nr:GHKL domain-containing protein [Lachnospiraceae bacterium]